jgi:hypothetical protein
MKPDSDGKALTGKINMITVIRLVFRKFMEISYCISARFSLTMLSCHDPTRGGRDPIPDASRGCP